jgi:predicted nucleic acid-binding protein
MIARFVAADASPLIGLATANAFYLLRELFDTLTITRIVKDEVAAGGTLPGTRELDEAMRAGWIRVAPAPLDTWRFAELDAGEASTIALALQRDRGALVLMDDTRGREQATALGLEVMGLAGVLFAAQRAGLIDDVQPLLKRLARRGFTVSEEGLRELADPP